MRVVTALVLCVFAAEQRSTDQGNPIERVVQLIQGLKTKIQEDGSAEQQVYDKYACWCEKTTARKAASIDNAKQLISALSENILKLKGRLGSYVAELQKLNKDIASTKETITEMEDRRTKEKEDYLKNKSALELGLANLKKAIQVLGAATVDATPNLLKDDPNRPSNAEAETKLLTIMAGVRSAMSKYSKVGTQSVNKGDLSTIKTFLSSPAASLLSANPATATYKSQSGEIQGILAQMEEDFENELATSAEVEQAAAADHVTLMTTKRADLTLLEGSLVKTTLAQGEDKKQLAEDQQEREETKVQLKTDEAFFEETKDACKAKAEMWSGRSRSRTEELAAIDQAIAVLTSDEAKATFERSANTFFQVSNKENEPQRTAAYNILKKVAAGQGSLRLAAIASKVSTTWHFDAVIADIDKMIATLREEEQADIEHRDWCEAQQNGANSKNENLEYDSDQLKKKKERAENAKLALEDEVTKVDGEIADLEAAMADALSNRNEENSAFKQAVKDDMDAVKLIGMAIEKLSGFYGFIQQDPEYKANPDTAPEAFEGGYDGAQSQGGGVMAILSMIKEDVEKEIGTTRKDEAADLAAYMTLRGKSDASMNALKEKTVSLGQDIASKMGEISDIDSVLGDKTTQKEAADTLLESLGPNCNWVYGKGKTSGTEGFETRRDARKAEQEGLENAKAVLSGAAPTNLGTLSTSVHVRRSVDDEMKALDDSVNFSFMQRRA